MQRNKKLIHPIWIPIKMKKVQIHVLAIIKFYQTNPMDTNIHYVCPVACNYATVTYGYFKNTEILPSFHSNLLYYKRYIDDIFGIWLPPSKQTNFLDLHLQLHNGRITTLTYVPKRPKSISLHPPSISAPFHLLQRIDKR
jgi:hypothetical protein